MPFSHPLIVHCSTSGTVVARFASSINFIKSIDEVDGMDVDVSTSMASFWELIFANEDVGVVMASAKEPLKFSEYSDIKLYSGSPVGESHDNHVFDMTIAMRQVAHPRHTPEL
jgi:hypothetical protein